MSCNLRNERHSKKYLLDTGAQALLVSDNWLRSILPIVKIIKVKVLLDACHKLKVQYNGEIRQRYLSSDGQT